MTKNAGSDFDDSLFDLTRQRARWEDEIASVAALLQAMSNGDTAEIAMDEFAKCCGSHKRAQLILIVLRNDIVRSVEHAVLLLELDKRETAPKP